MRTEKLFMKIAVGSWRAVICLFQKKNIGRCFVMLRMGLLCMLGAGFFLVAQESSLKTPAVWYALGCEAYQKNDYARACCFWQRASAVGGNATVRERVEHNCRCAYQKLELEEPGVSWWQRVRAAGARLPLLLLQLLFLAALYGALLWLYRGRRQRALRITSVVFFSVTVSLSGLLLLNRYFSDARTLGVVVQDQQVLYAGPGSDYPERCRLTCGQTVELCTSRGEWYKIRSSAGGIGWMPRAALMSVKP